MGFKDSFYAQFKRPTGIVGAFVGQLMALKNARRGAWVLELLGPQRGERVLEIGFGPGADAMRALAAVGATGSLAGADVSEVMLRQASARNQKAISEGRAEFVLSDIAAGLPWSNGEFDVVYSINCAQFWPDLAAGLREIERVLRPGGRAVVAVQPRQRGANETDTERWLERLVEAAKESALQVLRKERGPARPPVAAVLFQKL